MSSETPAVSADKPCLPPFSREQQKFLLEDLLRDVSRSFYLTLRVLPAEIRPQISLAYLLARASDTIADTKAVPKEKRIATLQQVRSAIQNATRVVVGADFIRDRSRLEIAPTTAETDLLSRLDDCRMMLDALGDVDRQLIRKLLQIIISGQIFDLEKFPGENESGLVALANDDEIDRYTYLVAGCVGEFWTRMCVAHFKELESWNGGAMEELGVRFGKGLQLVNVLRDIPKDLRIGRCYLPVSEPHALLDPANFDSIRREYSKWLHRAVAHLEAGCKYTMQIPPSLWRLRLACIWPIWIGLKTIARLRTGNPLDPAQRIKILRNEVYGVMARSFLIVRNDTALNRAFQKLRDAASHR